MGELKNLKVERTDGVGAPASGHTWVVVKSDTAAVEKDYEGAARAVIEKLANEESFSVSKETIDALTELAKLLDLDVEFKSESGEPVEPEGTTEPESTEATEPAPALTKDLLKETLREMIAEDDAAEPTVTRKAASKQPQDGEPATVEKGNGVFSDIVFAQNAGHVGANS